MDVQQPVHYPDPPRGGRPLASSLAGAAALLAGLWRVVPHPPNLTPVGALGIFAGARLRWASAFALPIAVMAASDAVLWLTVGYSPSLWVYASFLINVLLGRLLCRTEAPWRIGAVSLLASVQFYLLTNFGVWVSGGMYPQTLAGLGECYLAGLEFIDNQSPFVNTLLGDLAGSCVLFGAHAWLSRTRFPAERVHPLAAEDATLLPTRSTP
jgi:hypothetical protein